ncbi:hypothetical protein ID866_11434 [Astraeus odoratus]|nr:hypothetical protein ID866_11434 [Astraeus odoratus]
MVVRQPSYSGYAIPQICPKSLMAREIKCV